jgi:hypothetical protein
VQALFTNSNRIARKGAFIISFCFIYSSDFLSISIWINCSRSVFNRMLHSSFTRCICLMYCSTWLKCHCWNSITKCWEEPEWPQNYWISYREGSRWAIKRRKDWLMSSNQRRTDSAYWLSMLTHCVTKNFFGSLHSERNKLPIFSSTRCDYNLVRLPNWPDPSQATSQRLLEAPFENVLGHLRGSMTVANMCIIFIGGRRIS